MIDYRKSCLVDVYDRFTEQPTFALQIYGVTAAEMQRAPVHAVAAVRKIIESRGLNPDRWIVGRDYQLWVREPDPSCPPATGWPVRRTYSKMREDNA